MALKFLTVLHKYLGLAVVGPVSASLSYAAAALTATEGDTLF